MLYRALASVIVVGVGGACRSSPATPDGASGDDAPADARAIDARITPDTPIVTVDDGTPTREPCTDQFGSALSTTYGRLDGFLVAIVPPGANDCSGDSDHVHLQIRANAMIYDVAVNVGVQAQDVHSTTRELALGPWVEGWHPGAIEDYVALGLHAADIPLESSAQLVSDLDTDLATANHISIFATGYGPDGAHLVHRNGGGHDGLIVTQPLSSPSHARAFSFSDQSF
jgi:hypothetical protein